MWKEESRSEARSLGLADGVSILWMSLSRSPVLPERLHQALLLRRGSQAIRPRHPVFFLFLRRKAAGSSSSDEEASRPWASGSRPLRLAASA